MTTSAAILKRCRAAVMACSAAVTFVMIFPALLLALFTACSSDSYDTGTGSYSLTRADFGEIHSAAPKTADYIVTDDGDRLALTAPKTADWLAKGDTLYRGIIYYNLKEDGRAEVVSMGAVPVLSAKPQEEFEEGVKTDPLKFESLWLSRSGRFVNIGFYMKVGVAEDPEAIHTIGLVDEGTVDNADGTRTAVYRMYHDQGGVPEYYSSRYYVSIACKTIDADSVRLLMNTYDGEIERVTVVR